MSWIPLPESAAADLDDRTAHARGVLSFLDTIPALQNTRPVVVGSLPEVIHVVPLAQGAAETRDDPADEPSGALRLELVSAFEILDQILRWILDHNGVRYERRSTSVRDAFETFLGLRAGFVPRLELDAPGMLAVIAGLHRALLPAREAVVLRQGLPRGVMVPSRRLAFLATLCTGVVQHASSPSMRLVLRLTSVADELRELHGQPPFGVAPIHPLWIIRVAHRPTDPCNPRWEIDVGALWAMAEWHRARRFDLELRNDPRGDRWLIPSEELPPSGRFGFDGGDPRWEEFRD